MRIRGVHKDLVSLYLDTVPNNCHSAVSFVACLPKNPCLNGGACKIDVDEPEGYHCDCLPMYAGLRCEREYYKQSSRNFNKKYSKKEARKDF